MRRVIVPACPKGVDPEAVLARMNAVSAHRLEAKDLERGDLSLALEEAAATKLAFDLEALGLKVGLEDVILQNLELVEPAATEGRPARTDDPAARTERPSAGMPAGADRPAAPSVARLREPEPPKDSALAALLAFLIPGLGHIFLGRRLKGFACILFILGLYMAGFVISSGDCVSLYADLKPGEYELETKPGHRLAFIAQIGCGLPTILAAAHTHKYEIQTFLGMKAPKPDPPAVQSDEFVRSLPKQDEGLLYTMIAGLLNLILIYDALAGAPGSSRRDDRRRATEV